MITCKDGRVLAAQLRALIGAPSDLFYELIWLWPAPEAPPAPPSIEVFEVTDYGDGCIAISGFGYAAAWGRVDEDTYLQTAWKQQNAGQANLFRDDFLSVFHFRLVPSCCACNEQMHQRLAVIKDGYSVCLKCYDDPRVTFTGECLPR